MAIVIRIEFGNKQGTVFEYSKGDGLIGFSLPLAGQEWATGTIRVEDKMLELYDFVQDNVGIGYDVKVFNNGLLIAEYKNNGEIEYDIWSRTAVFNIASEAQ